MDTITQPMLTEYVFVFSLVRAVRQQEQDAADHHLVVGRITLSGSTTNIQIQENAHYTLSISAKRPPRRVAIK